MKKLMKRIFHDRRSATAIALAIMFVPLVIAAGAGVDFSRIASARALLQASADASAVAGAGAWQTSESYKNASSVATAAYSGTASQLPNFVSAPTPVISLTCTGSTTQCGGAAGNSSYTSTPGTNGCPTTVEYCVAVKVTATLNNSLIGFLIPSELLSAQSIVATNFPAQTITGKNIPPSPGFGSAGDVSGIYAYAVPMSGTGNEAVPDYTAVPTPNAACNSYSSLGPLAKLAETVGTTTNCNFLFIALSTSNGTGGAGGSITLQQNQPIAFSFVNYTGANGYSSSSSGYTQTSTNLEVYKNGSTTPSYYQTSPTITTKDQSSYYTVNTYNCTARTYNSFGSCQSNNPNNSYQTTNGTAGTQSHCLKYSRNGNCSQYQTIVTVQTTIPAETATFVGACPDHTLYGSLDPISVDKTTGNNNVGIPVADSLNVYSTAFEVVGYPPTYETNHALIPFIAPASMANNYTDADGNTYSVRAVCPNYTTANTSINAPINNTYASATGWSGLNIFSTAFPGQTYADSSVNQAVDSTGTYGSGSIAMTNGANDTFPPAISACTPAIKTQDGGVTTTTTDPWWDWNNSNSGSCGNESSAAQASYQSSGQPQNGNCAVLIQPLGTTPPVNSKNQALLPDYYVLVKNPSGSILAMDPVWDGQTFTDQIPGVIASLSGNNISVSGNTITDYDYAPTYSSTGQLTGFGFTPSTTNTYNITKGVYAGDIAVVEQPAQNASSYDFNLPAETSNRCYNPQNNGNPHGSAIIQSGSTTTVSFSSTTDNNNGGSVDQIANPQLGAILCNSPNPETYALYWNDLGTYGLDDVGYWNAVVAFTCSVPNTSTSGGGPATIVG